MSTTDTAAAAGPAAEVPAPRPVDAPTRAPWTVGWEPLAQGALLERLRVTGRARPAADPGLVADLRAHLGLDVVGPASCVGDPTVPVTASRLAGALACATHADTTVDGAREPSLPLACGALVDVLFRQLVTTGALDDPFEDALDALAVDDRRAPLLAWIASLAPSEEAELRAEVERQADGLRSRWPALDAAWLPRTKASLRVPAATGGIELVARVDLVVGRPAVDTASVALVDVTSGSPRARHRVDRRFGALVETLRSGVPPFAVATYFARTGELEVDAVTTGLLAAAARRCRAGIQALSAPPGVRIRDADALARSWCDACADDPLGPAAPVAVASPRPPRSLGAARPAPVAGRDADDLAAFPEEAAA
jgi:hypothetical protein